MDSLTMKKPSPPFSNPSQPLEFCYSTYTKSYSNNSLINLIFSAIRHITLRQKILEIVSYPRSVELMSLEFANGGSLLPLHLSAHTSLHIDFFSLPGTHFFSFVLPSILSLILSPSWFTLILTTCFIDLILYLNKWCQDYSVNSLCHLHNVLGICHMP